MTMSRAELQAALIDARIGLQEKVDGHRCVVVKGPDGRLSAYNRRGEPSADVPRAARDLAVFGVPFAIDGERLVGNHTGAFVAFDLLEWDGTDLRSQPYRLRIAMLGEALRGVGLVSAPACASLGQIGDQALHMLEVEADAERGLQLISEIQGRGGEGVIARHLEARYHAGNTQFVRRYKFLAEVDVVVLEIKPGDGSSGSLCLGLSRTDGSLVCVGNVRSGLTEDDMAFFARELAQGRRPVIRVRYQASRSLGIALAEPRTHISWFRQDKTPAECGIDQLGSEKVRLAESLPAWPRLPGGSPALG